MTGTSTPNDTRPRGLFAGAAASLSVNLAISLAAWFGTAVIDGVWLPAIAAALLVSLVLGVALLTTPRWRWFGAGVIAGAGMALVLTPVALTALGS